MRKLLDGKVALLTGAGGGKGLALAKLFISEGAKVIITDVEEAGCLANVAAAGSGSEFKRLDVTREDEWAVTVQEILAQHGQLDILVNSARIHTRNSDLSITSLQAWRDQMAVNVDGAFLGIKHCLPALRRAPGGAIVNVVSLSAIAPFAPTPVYSAAHAALLNLTKTTAVNCARAREDVRVNAVICGMSSNSPVGAIMDVAEKQIPMGRPANAEDIAEAILWLASNKSRYVTGSDITLDGGYTSECYPGT